ncbi:hypothetical protein D3C77_130070 [compost metagenome]
MIDDDREKALEAWRQLYAIPELRMSAAEKYDELVSLADKYQRQGLIDAEEKNSLILEATERYATAVEGLGQGT